MKALITYAFRTEGEEYKEEIKGLLLKAIKQDLNLKIGDPAEIPPLITELFKEIKTHYLAGFSRSARRISLGLLAALVIDPTVLNNPSLFQPGFYFGYNLSEAWILDLAFRLPLSLPIWSSIRGQIGLIWYPSFQIEKISTAISASCIFALDDLTSA